MSFETDLIAWDGKSIPDLESIYERQSPSPSFVDDLLSMFQREDVQVGATWMLKRCLEQDGAATAAMASDLYGALDSIEGWESTLHVLQCIPYLPIPPARRQAVEVFLRAGLLSQNKFVRAWTFGGFFQLAQQYAQYQNEVDKMLETALETEPPSVRARIRQVRKGR